MANTKISALTSATTPLAGTETLPVVQSSTTKQVSVANLTAGRAVATGNLTTTGSMSYTVNTVQIDGLTGTNSSNGAYFTLMVGGATAYGVGGWANSTVLESVPASTGGLTIGSYTGTIKFQTNGRTTQMYLDTNGNLLIGSPTANAKIYVSSGASTCARFDASTNSANPIATFLTSDTTGNSIWQYFYTDSGSLRGSISYNRTGGLTVYNTTSDYRAKTVNGPVVNALSKLMLLKPSTGRMNGATQDIDFFIAHELQEVIPSAVTGEKDAVNDDNTPQYQMVDKSAVIPLLTAALQEAHELIKSLTARIEALER